MRQLLTNKKIALSTIYGLYTEFERKARGGIFQKIANFLSPYQINYLKTLIKHYFEKRFHKGVFKMIYKGYYGLMKEIVDNDQILFKYASQDGEISDESNPNGSMDNIAGICNAGKNVFGMMPHPERAADYNLTNQDGKALFESLLKYC